MRDIDTLITTLGAFQRMKLTANEHKGSWMNEEYGQLLLNLDCERREFIVELGSPDATPESVWSEAADLANFAAMICQHFAKRYNERKNGEDNQRGIHKEGHIGLSHSSPICREDANRTMQT